MVNCSTHSVNKSDIPVPIFNPMLVNVDQNTHKHICSQALSMATAEPYEPVQYHWFFNQQVDSRDSWQPFSREDSQRLEDAFSQGLYIDENVFVLLGHFQIRDIIKHRPS